MKAGRITIFYTTSTYSQESVLKHCQVSAILNKIGDFLPKMVEFVPKILEFVLIVVGILLKLMDTARRCERKWPLLGT